MKVTFFYFKFALCFVVDTAFMGYKNRCIVRIIVLTAFKIVSSFPGQILFYTSRWNDYLLKLIKVSRTL